MDHTIYKTKKIMTMRKIRPILALGALLAVSCSQVESYDVASVSEDNVIGFISSTTRAETLTLSDLTGNKDGFAVYGEKGNSGSWDTEMDGNNKYSFATGAWAWTETSPTWPDEDEDGGYPINFYAIYTEDGIDGFSSVTTTPGQIAITYTAPTDGQNDILVATASTDVRPAGDKLPLTFCHILSKVTFDITADESSVVYTQEVGLNNINSSRIYKLYEEEEENRWADLDQVVSEKYPYLVVSNSAASSANGSLVGSYGDLMLLPQSTTSWNTEDATVSGSHIFLTYRAEDSSGNNIVGYSDAEDHPNYDPIEDAAYDNVALFVKVGYPVADDDGNFTIESGYSYNYNINLMTTGASNGYLLDDYYYDEEGDVTEFEVEGKEIGDPISEGYIDFTVTVKAWEESSSTIE